MKKLLYKTVFLILACLTACAGCFAAEVPYFVVLDENGNEVKLIEGYYDEGTANGFEQATKAAREGVEYYNTVVKKFSQYEIIDDDNYAKLDPNEEITRSEFVKLWVRCTGIGDISAELEDGYTVPFTDINADSPYYDYIRYAYSVGMISGTSDTTFDPDSPILIQDVLKIIGCDLGYQPYAEENGGYPFGFITFGERNNLTWHLTHSTYDKNATRKEAVIMANNALSVGPMKQLEGTSSYAIFNGTYDEDGNLLYPNESYDMFFFNKYYDLVQGQTGK